MIIQEIVENSDGLEEIIENFVFLSVPSPLNVFFGGLDIDLNVF